jgi:hypothetical protein
MVAMRALGARAVRRGGSSPLPRTTRITGSVQSILIPL